MPHYLAPTALRNAILDSQAGGRMTVELYRCVALIVDHIGYTNMDREEVLAGATLTVLSRLHEIDATRNVFAYITAIVKSEHFRLWRKAKSHAALKEKYKATLLNRYGK